MTQPTETIEIVDGASRCRDFNARGRQCGNYTRRVIVSANGHRQSNCGKH